MLQYTMKQIKDSFPKEKTKGDSVLGKLFSRPLSYPLTYICLNVGMSAWLASVISAIMAFVGCLLFMFNNSVCRWCGIALLLLWTIMDCVDGNIARIKQTQGPFGEFMDAESGYVMYACVYLAIGVASYHDTILFQNCRELPLIFGAVASICDVLARLIYQKFTNAEIKSEGIKEKIGKSSRFGTIRKKLSVELGVSGLVIVLMIIGQIFGGFDFISIFYFAYCGASALTVFVLYAVKARKKGKK